VVAPIADEKRRQLMARAKLCRSDFREFVKFVMNVQPQPFQKDLFDALQDIADNPAGKRLLVIMPPGYGKTTIVAVAFTAFMIGRSRTRHFGLLSYADRVAWRRSGAVKKLIESSQPYHLIFPGVKPGDQWSASEMQVERPDPADPHPTLRSAGATSAVVAYRLNGTIFDDMHDKKNVKTIGAREEVWKNYEESISTRMTEDAWAVGIGTRWAEDDWLGRVMENEPGLWKVIHIKALNAANKSTWPQAYSTAFLLKKRREKPALFAMQYQGDTSGGEAQIIRVIHTYKDDLQDVRKMDLLIGASWDTAMKEKEVNDFTVSYVGGLDEFGRIWVLDRIKDRYTLPALLDQMDIQYNFWRPFTVWIEDQSSGTSAIQTVIEESPFIPVKPVNYPGGKTPRAHTLSQHLHNGTVLLPAWADWLDDTIHFLTKFPNAGFDDDVDALFILVDNLLRVKHPAMYNNRRNRAILRIHGPGRVGSQR